MGLRCLDASVAAESAIRRASAGSSPIVTSHTSSGEQRSAISVSLDQVAQASVEVACELVGRDVGRGVGGDGHDREAITPIGVTGVLECGTKVRDKPCPAHGSIRVRTGRNPALGRQVPLCT